MNQLTEALNVASARVHELEQRQNQSPSSSANLRREEEDEEEKKEMQRRLIDLNAQLESAQNALVRPLAILSICIVGNCLLNYNK